MSFISNNQDFDAKRLAMVEHIRQRGNISDKVLDAMARIPREKFVLPAYKARAYEDSALPISASQTISQPYTVAYMTEQLDARAGQKVLEIGTGSGYQASILYMMGCDVYTVERIEELYEVTKRLMRYFDMPIHMKLDDGTLGWPEEAPFDRIIITAAAPEIPDSLRRQLKIGGRMVIPVGNRESQTMMIVIRNSEKDFQVESKDRFKFVPLIGKEAWNG